MGEGLGEIGHSESQKGVVFLYLECSLERLKQPVGAGHRLEQPVVGIREPFSGGGSEGAANAALCSTER